MQSVPPLPLVAYHPWFARPVAVSDYNAFVAATPPQLVL
jgi:hypothetical protein